MRAVTVRLDPQATLRSLRRIDPQRSWGRRFLRATHLDTLAVGYEDLVADPWRIGEVFDFLGVAASDSPPSSSMRKLNSSPKGKLVENWPEVAAALAPIRYASLLG